MKASQAEYSIEHDQQRTIVKGVLRLPSADAYDAVFAPVSERMAQPDRNYQLDMREVTFMNSSGIRALANLIMAARHAGGALTIVGSAIVPWQKKTMASLGVLYDRVTIQLL